MLFRSVTFKWQPFGFVFMQVSQHISVCVCVCVAVKTEWIILSVHTLRIWLFISFENREGAMNFFFIASWLLHLHVCALVWVCNLDTLVLWFTFFPSNHREKKCLPSRAVVAASQPMCWLQGPAHIHMFPVCLAQQDTGWLHALLIIPAAQALQGH